MCDPDLQIWSTCYALLMHKQAICRFDVSLLLPLICISMHMPCSKTHTFGQGESAPVEASGVLSQQEGPWGRPPRQPLQLTQCSDHMLPRLAIDHSNAHSLAVPALGGLIRHRWGRGRRLRLGALACTSTTPSLCPFTLQGHARQCFALLAFALLRLLCHAHNCMQLGMTA